MPKARSGRSAATVDARDGISRTWEVSHDEVATGSNERKNMGEYQEFQTPAWSETSPKRETDNREHKPERGATSELRSSEWVEELTQSWERRAEILRMNFLPSAIAEAELLESCAKELRACAASSSTDGDMPHLPARES